jgi:tRNA (cytosine34-C5)-methyltransferase
MSSRNNDNDNDNNNGRKRKSNKSSNPLSDARKSQSFFEGLWNKKSGLGYALFVQYYGQQTAGVVVEDVTPKKGAAKALKQSVTAPVSNTVSNNNKGMSRAAKRRRKKKGGAEEQPAAVAESTTTTTPKQDSNSKVSPLHGQMQKCPEYAHVEPFIAALSKPLPLTFRLRQLDNYPEEEQEEYIEKQEVIRKELEDLKHFVAPVPFDPAIYQALDAGLHKAALSKTCPPLKELLMRSAASGCLARQELGSMLPILGLQRGKHLRKNGRVLDTCASPGSKTLQALEVVGSKGRVTANDVHSKRLETLQAAVQRSGIPELLDRLVFKQYDASAYPLPSGDIPGPHVVMTDVPCSGDGTVRKDAITVLPTWSPSTARALHDLQYRILVRALKVVRVGGVVSYSTCSLNPMENEAVVQAALLSCNRKKKESVELIEWPQVEGLTLRPGVSNWKVLDHHDPKNKSKKEDDDDNEDFDDHDDDTGDDMKGVWIEHASFADAKASKMKHCYPTLWPKSNGESDHLNLQHCRRLWPQDQDTGGFFVALIRKNAEFELSKK